MGNTVTLEFAGDAEKLMRASKQATKATDDVGDAAEKASRQVEESNGHFKRVSEASDEMATKASTATGAFGALASGVDLWNLKGQQRLQTLDLENQKSDAQISTLSAQKAALDKVSAAHGVGAAAAAKQSAAIQGQIDKLNVAKQARDAETLKINEQAASTQQLSTYLMGAQLAFDAVSGVTDLATLALKANTLGQIGSKVATIATTTATRAWAAAQWLMNSALLASPLTWIVVGIAAVVAVVVLIATKTHWFQDIWRVAWGGIKTAASATWDFLKKIPGWIGTAFSAIGNFVFAPFRWAFNHVADAWNNTIGQLSWSVPGWVPFIGGDTISVPKLPHFHTGGVVPGAAGSEMLAVLQAGETVIPAGAGGAIEIRSGGTQLDDLLVEILARSIRRRGGNVQLVLGGRNA